jgi:hypothetical protein
MTMMNGNQSIRRLTITISMHAEEPNEQNVNYEKGPGDEGRPGEDEVDDLDGVSWIFTQVEVVQTYEDSAEKQARLPRVEPGITSTSFLKNQLS